MRFVLLPGQHHDSVGVRPLIEGVAFGALLGDKAFDADWLRAELDDRGAAAVIPPKVNRKTIISFDRDMYRWRHLIENTFAKLKEFRAVATRYDKTDTSYTATTWIMMRSATDLGKADLHVFSKLFDDGLERGQEAKAFSWRQIGGHDDVLDFFVGHLINVEMTRQPAP